MCVQCNVCDYCAYAMRTKIRCAVSVVSREYIGLVTRTSVLGFLDQVILNPVCSATATETSLNIASLHVASFVGPQNAPLHNMLLLVAYCVPCIHNMLHRSILCILHTQYATSGAYCVGSIHMLFQWSSEGTQYALLENMSRGICLSF